MVWLSGMFQPICDGGRPCVYEMRVSWPQAIGIWMDIIAGLLSVWDWDDLFWGVKWGRNSCVWGLAGLFGQLVPAGNYKHSFFFLHWLCLHAYHVIKDCDYVWHTTSFSVGFSGFVCMHLFLETTPCLGTFFLKDWKGKAVALNPVCETRPLCCRLRYYWMVTE